MNIQRQKKAILTECKICEKAAIYSYYGVIVCESCKIFFRRHAKTGKEQLKCQFDRQCEINIRMRRICSYCRLMKCFDSGMQIEMIRPIRSKKNQRDTINSRALILSNTVVQFPTLNLLDRDQSTLTVDQWNLISNISKCFDQYTNIVLNERYMREQKALPIKLRFKSASLIELFQATFEEIPLLFTKNGDFLLLSTEDRSILLNNTIKPITVLSLNYISHVVGLTNYSAYYDAAIMISNEKIINIVKLLQKQFIFDIIIMKLLLAIFSFSTASYTIYSGIRPINLFNIKQILNIQNTYIEITWRYLIYKDGYEKAVKDFSNLIRCLLTVHNILAVSKDVEWFEDSMDEVVHHIEQTLVIN